jgi:glucokinase
MSFLGIDIGGTGVKAGLVSESGQLLRAARLPTPDSVDGFAGTVRSLWTQLAPERIDGIGIGSRGIIDPESTRVEVMPGMLRFLEGRLLRDFVPAGPPVVADNDARAALAGEVRWGAARGRRNVILLTLGTGVGGGVLADGRILRGEGGVAGHLGHYTLDPDGPLCVCGNHGCLQTYFSSRAIESEAAAMAHSGAAEGWPEWQTCEEIFVRASSGDQAARWIVNRAIRHLGAALAGLLHIFDPEVVLLGGQIAAAGEMLFDPLRRDVEQRTARLLRRATPIEPAALGHNAGILGAAALAQGIGKS